MAAFLTDRLLSPRAGSSAAVFFPIPRTFKTIWNVTCEWLLLIWMLALVAFFGLIAAGATGFLH